MAVGVIDGAGTEPVDIGEKSPCWNGNPKG